MNNDIKSLADRLVSARFQQEPLEAAMLGLPEGDVGLADLSTSAEGALVDAYGTIAAAAEELFRQESDAGALSAESDVLTLDMIRHTAASAVDALSVPTLEFTATDLFTAPLAGFIATVPQLPLDTADRRDGHLQRLADLPRYLDQLAERHREGLTKGRAPTARGVRAAINQIDKVLGDPALSGVRRDPPDASDDSFQSAQERRLEEDVVPAIRQFRAFLEDAVAASGRSDDQPGLAWLPDGDEMYRLLMRASTSTERTAEDLHNTGLAIIERLKEEFSVLGDRLWGTSDVDAIHERLRSDPELRYSSGEEILASAVEAVRRAEDAAPAWFGLVPKTPCAIEPIPEALADGSPPAYYYTGALDGSRVGTYFVNTTKPDLRFRHLAEAVAFHEAVPGHHFQLTIIQEVVGNHLVHSVFGDVATAEGWGLYAERLADEMGLYSNDLARLGMASTDAWRAARLVVDTGLHAFGWSRQRAIDWMAEHVPISPLEIHSEVDRYIAVPGQALAYMVGRLEIEECRRNAAERLGTRFDVREFHDVVLRSGPVPLAALAAAVDRWIVSAAS